VVLLGVVDRQALLASVARDPGKPQDPCAALAWLE